MAGSTVSERKNVDGVADVAAGKHPGAVGASVPVPEDVMNKDDVTELGPGGQVTLPDSRGSGVVGSEALTSGGTTLAADGEIEVLKASDGASGMVTSADTSPDTVVDVAAWSAKEARASVLGETWSANEAGGC